MMLLDSVELQQLIYQRINNLQAILEALPEHLAIIENAAEGQPVEREKVLASSHLILDNLYRGLLSPRICVDKDFWASPLGLTIARAHTNVIRDEDVISQAEAAHLLSVSREYISHLVENGKVPTVVRDAKALRSRKQPREMLYLQGLEALKEKMP